MFFDNSSIAAAVRASHVLAPADAPWYNEVWMLNRGSHKCHSAVFNDSQTVFCVVRSKLNHTLLDAKWMIEGP
jgi:hypothetical protein